MDDRRDVDIGGPKTETKGDSKADSKGDKGDAKGESKSELVDAKGGGTAGPAKEPTYDELVRRAPWLMPEELSAVKSVDDLVEVKEFALGDGAQAYVREVVVKGHKSKRSFALKLFHIACGEKLPWRAKAEQKRDASLMGQRELQFVQHCDAVFRDGLSKDDRGFVAWSAAAAVNDSLARAYKVIDDNDSFADKKAIVYHKYDGDARDLMQAKVLERETFTV